MIPFFKYIVTIFSTDAASVLFRKEVPGMEWDGIGWGDMEWDEEESSE